MVLIPLMVVWSTVITEPGEQCAVRDGMIMMPKLSVTSLDTTLMVIILNELHFTSILNSPAVAVMGFPIDENLPVFLTHVDCVGTEQKLASCEAAVPTTTCSGAGVACGKSLSNMTLQLTMHSTIMHIYLDIVVPCIQTCMFKCLNFL